MYQGSGVNEKPHTTMTLDQIAVKLENAGCTVTVDHINDRVKVLKTPNGKFADYGWCIPSPDGDVRDITAFITKRAGEIKDILRA